MRIAGLALLLALSGCGGALTYKIASSAKAPGANATVKADISKNQHITRLTVSAAHLAPPARITAGTSMFTIWARKGPESQWVRVGNLKYDSSSREASFQGTVPRINFDMEITTEKDDNVASPSPNIVFSQHVGPS